MSSIAATTSLDQHPSESILRPIDFRPVLLDSETLSGTPTVTASPTGSTIASESVNSAATAIMGGDSIPAGKAVLFRLSGLTAGTRYTITATASTSLSNTRVVVCYVDARAE